MSAERTPARTEHASAEFRWPVRVYYEDTDAAGVVYYANYLRFLERARTEWLSALGIEVDALAREHGVAFVVHRLDVEYRRPARLGERLAVGVHLVGRGRSRLELTQDVRRDDVVLVHAAVSLACVEPARWRPARIPAFLLDRLPPTA